MLSGLQTLRLIALAAAFSFFVLVLPAIFVASGTFLRVRLQLVPIALVFVGAACGALIIRWLQTREEPSPRSVADLALSYRNRFLLQVAAAQLPGALAFVFSIFTRPFPAIAILLGVVFTAALVWLVAPTEKNLTRLEQEASDHNVSGDVRGALDELYSWKP